ncbi:MAG: NAD(+) diphosphatase [Pseudomonadales bacterium]|nr:NAD(+) diphosphatase [Pseudomonadales bacterium]
MGILFKPGVKPPTDLSTGAIWFAFLGGELVVSEDEGGILVPQSPNFSELNIAASSQHYLGSFHSQHCFAVSVIPESTLPNGYYTINIRELLGQSDQAVFQVAGRAKQVLDWELTHQFCGQCGEKMGDHAEDRAKVCDVCNLIQYPRISPCVICLVTRGDEVLLGRSPHFPPRVYSTLAGFIEPGETIEEAVQREVFEEVGVTVKDIKYVGSQPWPFPNSLMIGFHAKFESGEIVVDGKEIIDARWWSLDALPKIPPSGSIARLLIDEYIENQ